MKGSSIYQIEGTGALSITWGFGDGHAALVRNKQMIWRYFGDWTAFY
jgi:hypothetical protein